MNNIAVILFLVFAVVSAQTPSMDCPQAGFMGFATQNNAIIKGHNICPNLKNACCTVASMNTYGLGWKKYTQSLSNVMWSISQTQSAAMNLMAGLKSGFGDKVPVQKARRILQAAVSPKGDSGTTSGSTGAAGSKTSPKPSKWNVGSNVKGDFAEAWNLLNEMHPYTSSFINSAKLCLVSIAELKARMACAVCDSSNVKSFKGNATIESADVVDFQRNCVSFFSYYTRVKEVMTKTTYYIMNATKGNAETKSAQSTVYQKKLPELNGCIDTKNPKRVLQAVEPAVPVVDAKYDSWTKWKKDTTSKKWIVKVTKSSACLASEWMGLVATNLVYGSNVQWLQNDAVSWWSALEAGYVAASTTTAIGAWNKFKGTSGTVTVKMTVVPKAKRLQVVAPVAFAKLEESTKGVDLSEKYKLTGMELPSKLVGDKSQKPFSQSSNLIKILTTVTALVFLCVN